MSVIVVLVGVSDTTADSLVADPDTFQRFMLGGELKFESPEERAAYYRNGVPPKSLREAVRPPTADMDKAWAAISHVLSKHENPLLRFIEHGGRDIRLLNKRKRGPKPGQLLARAFSAAQVTELYQVLHAIDSDSFTRAFDLEELKAGEVYPEVWDEYGLDYVLPWFEQMKDFIKARTEQNEGLLVGVS